MTQTQTDTLIDALLQDNQLCNFHDCQQLPDSLELKYISFDMAHCMALIDFCIKHHLFFYLNYHLNKISISLTNKTTCYHEREQNQSTNH